MQEAPPAATAEPANIACGYSWQDDSGTPAEFRRGLSRRLKSRPSSLCPARRENPSAWPPSPGDRNVVLVFLQGFLVNLLPWAAR